MNEAQVNVMTQVKDFRDRQRAKEPSARAAPSSQPLPRPEWTAAEPPAAAPVTDAPAPAPGVEVPTPTDVDAPTEPPVAPEDVDDPDWDPEP